MEDEQKIDFAKIEKKWQDKWESEKVFEASDNSQKPKYYVLEMFPYPSAAGLHMGHAFNFTIGDVSSRFKIMQGFNVLHPAGFDSLGLPAENAAIKAGKHPEDYTNNSIKNFIKQEKALGLTYAWDRQVNTADPDYYKWDQWIFLKMFEKGLVYEKEAAVNWCNKCNTIISNEQAQGGECDRCGTKIEIKQMKQWFLKITDYADRLLEGHKNLKWPEKTIAMQKNWIGKSYGTEINFEINDKNWPVFTTRPDTIFGVTFMVVSAQHKNLMELVTKEQKKDVEKFLEKIGSVSEKELADMEKEGVFTGSYAINPATRDKVPVYAGNFVVADYGGGMVMAVPAHDQRDFEFAKKYNIPIKQVIVPCAADTKNPPKDGLEEVKRDTVIVHLRDKSTGKFALLNWHGTLEGITTAIMGGIEPGQTPKEAALMEISEEAALNGVKIIKEASFITAARYCASHKNQNRCAHAYSLLAEIDNLKNQGIISEDEKKIQTVIWVDEKEVLNKLVPEHQKQVWKLLHEETALTGEGYLIESKEFNGISNEEAKKKISDWLISQNKARKVINYKLRDWSVARQRYWGTPIPLIHCEKCKKDVVEKAVTINFYEQDTWQRLISGKKEIETRALNPEEKNRYFGNIKNGSYIKALNKLTNEEVYLYVKNTWQFKNLKELFTNKNILAKIYAPNKIPADFTKLQEGYSYTPDYLDKVEKNGLIAWEVERVVPGIVSVLEKELPVKLPKEVKFGVGNPLLTNENWLNVKCPKCGEKARREANTMDTFVNSSWYFLRYCDPKNNEKIFDKEKVKYWMPVDLYVGGAEHACMHLIYSRFYTMFLHDIGLIGFEEPAPRLFHQGMINDEKGEKMSKSKGNVIEPLETMAKYGVDATRFFLLSEASPDKGFNWSDKGIQGSTRIINKIWKIGQEVKFGKDSKEMQLKINKTIKNVTEQIENIDFRKSTIEVRELFDLISKQTEISKETFEKSIKLIAPFCPHIAEELWEKLGNKGFISVSEWPVYDKQVSASSDSQGDINEKIITNIKPVIDKILQTQKVNKIYLYVMPFEIKQIDKNKIEKALGKSTQIFAVNDLEKHDPENKYKKALPGKPSVFVE